MQFHKPKFNEANMKKLIAFLKKLPDENFDMSDYGTHEPDCGTVACLAGNTVLISGSPWKIGFDNESFDVAKKFLGLSESVAELLFDPVVIYNYSFITRSSAIKTLQNFMKTGEVVWYLSQKDYNYAWKNEISNADFDADDLKFFKAHVKVLK